MDPLHKDIRLYLRFLIRYFKLQLLFGAHILEGRKNHLVDILMFKRGIFQKKVWHGSMIGLSVFGLITSGIIGGQSLVSTSFPGVGGENPRFASVLGVSALDNQPVLNSLYETHTNVSDKPRSEIIEYEVKSGDTLSGVAQKENISVDTIRWANNLTDDRVNPGDKLKILPVSGVAHTVVAGDTLESVAKKYSAQSQAILDFPFNDVPDDFSLKPKQVLIIPDGTPPTKTPSVPRKVPQHLGSGQNVSSPTFSAPGGGSFIWPSVTSGLSQYFAWYHPGIDLPNSSSPPVVASDGGVVTMAGWPDNFGYGNRVTIDHGNGYTTIYAHLSNIYVTTGQNVSRGQKIGQMGNTGRSTGTHLHFEIRYKGIAVNPLAILK